MRATQRGALTAFFVLLVFGVGFAWAQQRLVVNGQAVSGLTTSLVGGSSYVPAQAFADALGAQVVYDAERQTVSFDLAGHILTLGVYETPAAVPASGAALLDGQRVAGEGAVLGSGTVFVPVKAVAAALGGSVSYLEQQQTVMVVFPRSILSDARLEGGAARGSERFVLDFDRLTAFETTYNRALGTLRLRFERTDLAAPQQFTGSYFKSASLTPSAGYLDFRVTLLPGHRYETFTSPRRGGFSLVVDIIPDAAGSALELAPSIVLDPGHGGRDPGVQFASGSEATLTLGFARMLAESLRERGLESRLTRAEEVTLGPALRSQQGVGADFFLSIHGADLLSGHYNLYYLGDAPDAPTLSVAMRENAAAALDDPGTDALRRQILLGLVPDLSLGETYAASLERDLAQQRGLRVDSLQAAPLAVLDGAAGRGILLELSPDDLTDRDLAEALAAAIITLNLGGAD